MKIDVQGTGAWEDTQFYTVFIGRTGILYDSTLKINAAQRSDKKFNFWRPTNSLMTPSFQVIVYYISTYGEIVFDIVKVNLDVSYPNNVRT